MDFARGFNVVILTAGKGSRMKSDLPKIMHKVAGRTLFEHVLACIENVKVDKNIVVITSNDILDNFSEVLPKRDGLNYVIQEERKGTGHAVMCGVNSQFWNSKNEYTGVFYGDVPFIESETIQKMFSLQKKYDLVILGFDCEDQSRAYGRLFTNKDLNTGDHGILYQIREFKDLMREKPRLCNSGIMVGKTEIFEKLLPEIKTNNKAKEYYLTDIVELANQNGYKVGTYICNEDEVIGINSRIELAHAEKAYQEKVSERHLINGATMINRDSVHFSYDTQIGKDVIIEPNVFFGTGVKIGDNCVIRAGSYLENIEMKNGSDIGPYARTRGTNNLLGEKVHVGNFAEIKNSTIGKGSKIGHFCYIGDTIMGDGVNFGAGSVVCNYDGEEKHQTMIGKNCFIGSNSTIVAPCKIEDNSYIGAGSVITKNVKSGTLALGRARQTEIKGWVEKRGLLNNKIKNNKEIKDSDKTDNKEVKNSKSKK